MLGKFIRALVVLLAMPTVSLAVDVEGKDHPLVGRYAGSERIGYQTNDYDEVTLVNGPFDPVDATKHKGPGFQTLEGRTYLIYYGLPKGRSTLEVLRNHEASLRAKGFEIKFTCATSDGDCFVSKSPDAAYYLGNAIGDPLSLPKLNQDYVHNWFDQRGRYLLARLAGPTGDVHVGIYLGESARGSVEVVRIVETKPMDADKIVVVDSGQMQKAIDETGKVSLYGILFDFDQDMVKPESKPTLDEIAKLLQAKPTLRVSIVGHTDNRGTADYNLDLSGRRAAHVVEALVSGYGVDPARLSSSGAGLTMPIADNATEEGRQKNRRVELVAQ